MTVNSRTETVRLVNEMKFQRFGRSLHSVLSIISSHCISLLYFSYSSSAQCCYRRV